MPSVTDLYAKIGFKVDDTGLKEFSKEMINLKDTIAECLSGLDGFVKAMKKISSELKTIKTTRALTEEQIKQKEEEKLKRLQLRNKLMEQKLDLDPRKVAIAELREERLQESAKRRAEGKSGGFSWGVALGNLISEAIINGFKALYGFIKTVVGQLWGIFKNAWQAMFTYRDYRRYTNLRDAELSKWTAMAAGYATRPEIAENMMEVQQSLVGIRLGQGNLMPYRMLGISADTTDPYEILRQARTAILGQNIAPEMARYFLNQMGFGNWAYAAIMNSRDEKGLESAIKAHDLEIQKQAELAEKLSKLMSLVTDQFSKLLEILGDSVFADALDYIRRWIIEFVNVLRSGIFEGKSKWGKISTFFDLLTSNPETLHKMALENSSGEALAALRAQNQAQGGGYTVYNDYRKSGVFNPVSETDKQTSITSFYGSDVTEETIAQPNTQDDIQQSYIGENPTVASMYNSFKRLEQSDTNAKQRFNERKNAAIEAAVARGMTRERAEQVASEWNL